MRCYATVVCAAKARAEAELAAAEKIHVCNDSVVVQRERDRAANSVASRSN